jgi:Family of unknown function (DUF6502)
MTQSAKEKSGESVKENLVAAFRYLLKPLVRLAIRNSVSFLDFSEALKKAYVDVSVRQMRAAGIDVTEEGISLISSVPQEEVQVLLSAGADAKFAEATHEISPIAIVLNAWHIDPRFTGPYGVLRDLHFSDVLSDTTKPIATFTNLVNTFCPGSTPQAILDELIRIGAVQSLGNDYYRAVRRSYVAEPLSPGNIRYIARVVHDLCETLDYNLFEEKKEKGTGRIQRTILPAYAIPMSEASAFDKYIRDRGQIFADDVDNWLTARDFKDLDDPVVLGAGFYHFVVNEEDEAEFAKAMPESKDVPH